MKIEIQKIIDVLQWPPTPAAGGVKYQWIYNALKQAILASDLPHGSDLPPTRALAEAMGISRSTILKVYDLLKLEGLLLATIGSGHTVHVPSAAQHTPRISPAAEYQYAEVSEAAAAFHKNLKLINSIDDPGIAFRPGVPPLDLFPVAKWKKISNEYWQFVRASELSYYAGAGVEVLRQTIANYLNLRRNVKCHYSQVFVVSGSLQSLYTIGNLLLNPGDEVLVENPTFPNVHSVFKGFRAKVTGVGLDENGLNPLELEEKIGTKTKLLHLTTSCQYPFGMQMPEHRKTEILALANQHGLYIIENDYENEVNYPNHDGRPLFSLDTQQRTFYLGTFNRILHPSIRVGFVVVPQHLVPNFQALVMHSHRFVSPAVQVILRSFIEKKFLHDHLKNVVLEAEKRHATFLALMKEHLHNYLEPLPMQAKSLHIVALLKGNLREESILPRLAESGIIAHALSKCYVETPKKQGLIFGYACIKSQHIAPLIKRMAKVLHG
jgi:GntR family transcriptional regulator/MocR family aminotransferase